MHQDGTPSSTGILKKLLSLTALVRGRPLRYEVGNVPGVWSSNPDKIKVTEESIVPGSLSLTVIVFPDVDFVLSQLYKRPPKKSHTTQVV